MIRLPRAIMIGLVAGACSGSGFVPATATPSPMATALARPIDYVLPSGCDFVGASELRNRTTYWRVKCSSPGRLHAILTPTLASQGWEPCGIANNRAYFRTTAWLITVSILDSSEPGELSEVARSSGCGNLPEE